MKGSKLSPRFSPKGTKISLSPAGLTRLAGFDHRTGRLKLGALRDSGHAGQLFALARSKPGAAYDLLFIDADHDGGLADETALTTKPSKRRGNIWSSFSSSVRVPHQQDGATVYEDYPLNFWAVAVDAQTAPPIIRFSRRGFLVANAGVDGAELRVVLADGNNDGLLGKGDSWGVFAADDNGPFTIQRRRAVDDFAWAAEKAWKLELSGTTGRRGFLVAHDPGLTQAEDEIKRDRLRADRLAPRARQPVKFRRDVDSAMAAARTDKMPFYLDFETTWCGPCKTMDQLVYTARDVAAAANGITCIKVDGDERPDLTKRYNVNAFPTGILFGSDGRETARFVGYRGVKQMTAFFKKARP
jgi:thiol-disulfide isomerase/thioredoxin